MGYYTPLLSRHVLNAHRAIISESLTHLELHQRMHFAAVLSSALARIEKFNSTPRAEMSLELQQDAVSETRAAAQHLNGGHLLDVDYRRARASHAFTNLADYVADCFVVHLADQQQAKRDDAKRVSREQRSAEYQAKKREEAGSSLNQGTGD